MNRPLLRGRIALIAAATAVLLASAPTAANTGNPPPVRTSSGGIIVKDILTEHRYYSDWHRSLVDPIFMVGSGYAPGDLAAVSQAGIAGTG